MSDVESSSWICLFLAAMAINAWLLEKLLNKPGWVVGTGNGRNCPNAACSRRGSSWKGCNESMSRTGGKCGPTVWLDKNFHEIINHSSNIILADNKRTLTPNYGRFKRTMIKLCQKIKTNKFCYGLIKNLLNFKKQELRLQRLSQKFKKLLPSK